MLKGAENFNHSFKRREAAFTLIELIVAVTLLVLAITFSSMIFKVSIGTRRTAAANDEIMQKVRAITDQLTRDFTGLRKDAPLLIQFEQLNPTSPQFRFDQIMFFATGDFQSIQLYDGSPKMPASSGDPVRGNAARIYYGHGDFLGIFDSYQNTGYFTRRQHILTADADIYDWPKSGLVDFNSVDPVFLFYPSDDFLEHDRMSLAQWKVVDQAQYDLQVIPVCFNNRTKIDLTNPQGLTLHNLMCENVTSFAIQWAYWDDATGQYLWFPDDLPYGTGTYLHYNAMNAGFPFGVRFNITSDSPVVPWFNIAGVKLQTGLPVADNFYPDALRFTFTLRDSKGVIETPRTFSHIVYIGD
jgi:type II secretory pathway pseudopilin PulG